MVCDLPRGMREIELDRTRAAGLEVDEQRSIRSVEHIARMGFPVEHLLGAALSHLLAEALQGLAQERTVGLGQTRGAGGVVDEGERLVDPGFPPAGRPRLRRASRHAGV